MEIFFISRGRDLPLTVVTPSIKAPGLRVCKKLVGACPNLSHRAHLFDSPGIITETTLTFFEIFAELVHISLFGQENSIFFTEFQLHDLLTTTVNCRKILEDFLSQGTTYPSPTSTDEPSTACACFNFFNFVVGFDPEFCELSTRFRFASPKSIFLSIATTEKSIAICKRHRM